MKTFTFLIIFFVAVFSLGFLTGYFLERTSIGYTQSQLQDLRVNVENMQIQEMFAAGERTDCRLMFTTMGSLSYNLYDLVNKLKETQPENTEFYDLKRDADFLSLRAWILARNIRERCTETIFPILYVYSNDCPECEKQDAELQKLKTKYDGVLVYAIDFDLNEPVIRLVKDAYGINSTPSMIINHRLYGNLSGNELENLVCANINCTKI